MKSKSKTNKKSKQKRTHFRKTRKNKAGGIWDKLFKKKEKPIAPPVQPPPPPHVQPPPPAEPIPQAPNQLNDDWTTVAKKEKRGEWDVLVIPINTMLYRGVYIGKHDINNKRQKQQENLSEKYYYATFPIAGYYAFDQEYRNNSAQGKIISYKTNNDICILDMASMDNYKKLETIANKDLKEVLYRAFPLRRNAIARDSDTKDDIIFAEEFCKLLDTKIPEVSGYGYTSLPGFHSEIMICGEKQKQPILQSTEWIWTPYFEEDYILEINNNEFTGEKKHTEDLEYEISGNSDEIHEVEFNQDQDQFPYMGKEATYIWKEPFKSKLLDYIKSIRNGRYYGIESEQMNLEDYPLKEYPEIYEEKYYPDNKKVIFNFVRESVESEEESEEESEDDEPPIPTIKQPEPPQPPQTPSVSLQTQQAHMPPKKLPRCPKGYRRNKQGICVPVPNKNLKIEN